MASEEHGFRPYRFPTFWLRAFENAEDITFYPELYYHGLKVTPQSWHTETDEPFLLCQAEPANLAVLSDPYFQTIAARIGARYAEQVLLPEGWTRPSDPSIYQKYIHVDDLEKIEGPPPDGSF